MSGSSVELPTHLTYLLMNAYHVLAKIISDNITDQKHYFVRAKAEGRAVALVHSCILGTPHEIAEIQFTVKKTNMIASPAIESPDEEIHSL